LVGTIYQGTWNAATNTPALASGVGTKGYYYIVSVAGTTNLDGITDWFVGDWAIFDGTAWQQVDNTDAVVSVNGQTGAVSLTTDNIPEGSTNQYFLNSRARAALSFTAGSGAYNSTTGVITIPTNTSQLTNGANFITLASLSGTAPIVYSNTTGAISITQAGTASNGYLSSTDWNTFNNKQVAGNYVTIDTTQTISGAKTFTSNVQLGVTTGIGTPTATPLTINLGDTFSNTAGTNLKLRLFQQSTGVVYGIGVSGSQMDFNLPADAQYKFWTGNAIFTNNVTALALIKSGGTSSQFLKADGSVDSSTYLTTATAASTYLPLSGGTLTNTAAVKLIIAGGTSQNGISYSAAGTANSFYTF
jgi:hypothetical protein